MQVVDEDVLNLMVVGEQVLLQGKPGVEEDHGCNFLVYDRQAGDAVGQFH